MSTSTRVPAQAQSSIFGPTDGASASLASFAAAPQPSSNAGGSWAKSSWSPGGAPAKAWEEPPELEAVDWSRRPNRVTFKRCFLRRGVVDAAAAEARRSALGIAVSDDAAGPAPVPLESFRALGSVLPQWLLQACSDNGWETPTPIQAQSIPLGLEGKNLIGIAQTGSGKTAAFLIPAVVHMEDQEPLTRSDPGPMALAPGANRGPPRTLDGARLPMRPAHEVRIRISEGSTPADARS